MNMLDIHPFAEYLRRQSDVIVAYLFGSVARDQAGPLSDIDIAVLLAPNQERERLIERQLTLLTALDELAEQTVQVTLLNDAPPLLVYEVVREGILLHQRSQAERVAFQVRGMKEYFDVQPMLARQNEALRRRIQEGRFGEFTNA